mmetsp:Transcript_12110/g.34249  ORF Transcript_12110/g.34249 Transcript_12110/m.34249 type:complete len:688 (-) Transcript_12110:607-2670(-)
MWPDASSRRGPPSTSRTTSSARTRSSSSSRSRRRSSPPASASSCCCRSPPGSRPSACTGCPTAWAGSWATTRTPCCPPPAVAVAAAATTMASKRGGGGDGEGSSERKRAKVVDSDSEASDDDSDGSSGDEFDAAKTASGAKASAGGAGAAETEVEKEMRLFEEDEARRKNKEVEQLASANKKKPTSKKKRSSSSGDSDSESGSDSGSGSDSEAESDSSEESEEDSDAEDSEAERAKSAKGSKAKAKVAAKGKSAAASKRAASAKEKKAKAFEVSDDSDISDAESDFEAGGRAGKKQGSSKPADPLDEEIDLVDLNAMQLTRDVLCEWVDEPFFGECIDGYVRLSIGATSSDPNRLTYRVCRISRIIDCEPYKVDKTTVDCKLELTHGKSAKEWRMTQISNGPFTQSEFDLWRSSVLKAPRVKMPTKRDLQRFEERIRTNVHEYRPDERAIRAKIEKKKKRRSRAVNFAMEKAEIQRDLEVARSLNDLERVSELELRLEELKEQQEKKFQLIDSNFANQANVNKRNQAINRDSSVQNVQRFNAKGEAVWNPFARKPTRPNNLWATLPQDAEAAEAGEEPAAAAAAAAKPAQDTPKDDKAGATLAAKKDALGLSQDRQVPTPQVREVKTIHHQINIGLDELDPDGPPSFMLQTDQGQAVPQKAKKGKKKSKGRPKGILSIEEYRRQLNF